MEERERESVCQREKRAYSAEIRWYSPFVQNEFIRGVRDSHCLESRFRCDKGRERQIGRKKEFHFLFFRGSGGIRGSAERLGRGKNGETGEDRQSKVER